MPKLVALIVLSTALAFGAWLPAKTAECAQCPRGRCTGSMDCGALGGSGCSCMKSGADQYGVCVNFN